MAKSKNVQISELLFLEICKFFLLGDEYSDRNIIAKGLTAKLEAISKRERYAARLLQRRVPNGRVEAPAAANNTDTAEDDTLTAEEDAKRLHGPIVDMLCEDAAQERYTLFMHGTRNVLGQLNAPRAFEVFNAVNNGEIAATEENCGDGCIIL